VVGFNAGLANPHMQLARFVRGARHHGSADTTHSTLKPHDGPVGRFSAFAMSSSSVVGVLLIPTAWARPR
jgi:hypothetical protein